VYRKRIKRTPNPTPPCTTYFSPIWPATGTAMRTRHDQKAAGNMHFSLQSDSLTLTSGQRQVAVAKWQCNRTSSSSIQCRVYNSRQVLSIANVFFFAVILWPIKKGIQKIADETLCVWKCVWMCVNWARNVFTI